MAATTQQIPYPQNFDLKIVVVASIPQEETKRHISTILSECHVVHHFVNVLSSAKGNYYSYCYNIDINSQEQFRHTYQMLRRLPGIRFVL